MGTRLTVKQRDIIAIGSDWQVQRQPVGENLCVCLELWYNQLMGGPLGHAFTPRNETKPGTRRTVRRRTSASHARDSAEAPIVAILDSYHLQLRQREYLLRISRAMTSRLDLPSLLRLILNSAVDMTGGEAGLIALRGAEDQFTVRASMGIPAALLPLFKPLWDDLPLLSSQADLAHWHIPNLSSRLGLVSASVGISLSQVVALPLVLEDRLEGIIYVFRKRDHGFSSNDRQFLASFADQAAIAVRNAQLYQQLSDEKLRLDAIIANSADGILILDRDQRVEVINRALSQMTGWTTESAKGRLCHEILELRDRQGRSLCEKECPLRPGTGQELRYLEGDILSPRRKLLTVGITYTPLYDQDGQLMNIVCNVHDITRFREAEELKSTFISVISHELKTPVALIKGYAGTLRREDADWDRETLFNGLSVIEEESDKLADLIDNLLDASRIQAGVLDLEISEVALGQLAAKVVSRLKPQTKGHRLVLALPDDLPAASGDPERLEAVFYNLLTNAIKYSPDGGEIRVGGHATEADVIVHVADQGVGIASEDAERLFQPFSRVDSGLTRRTPGAGLGLFLCKAIIEGLGGRIWFESEPGRGATFFFALPRADVGHPWAEAQGPSGAAK